MYNLVLFDVFVCISYTSFNLVSSWYRAWVVFVLIIHVKVCGQNNCSGLFGLTHRLTLDVILNSMPNVKFNSMPNVSINSMTNMSLVSMPNVILASVPNLSLDSMPNMCLNWIPTISLNSIANMSLNSFPIWAWIKAQCKL